MTKRPQPSSRLKIVVASEFYRPSRGGTETTTENLARGLAELGHEVLVVAPGGSLWRSSVAEDGGQRILRVRSLPLPLVPKLRVSWRSYPHLRRHLDAFGPDIIHVNNHLGIGKGLLRYGNKRSVPVVTGVHFMPESFLFNVHRLNSRLYHWWRMVWWRRIARIYNRATAVVGPTQTAVDYLTSAGLTVPGHVISNGVNLHTYHPPKSQKALRSDLGVPDKPTVLYVGRLSAEKQLDVVINAVAAARKDVDLQLVLVGDGWVRRNLKRLTADRGVHDAVIFTGYLEKAEDKIHHLMAADIFVMPSTVELQSIVTLEAMACGKPVVAVNEGALPEMVRHKHNGELFSVRDSERLAELLVDMLTNKQRLRQYGQASKEMAATHDLREMPSRYLELYRRLIAG